MIRLHKKTYGSIIATKKVERKTVSRWGILSIKNKKKRYFQIKDVVEKPSIKKAPSNFAIIGRYILPTKILGEIKKLKPGQGGVMARGAGSYAQLTAKDGKYVIIKLPSGETRMVLSTCRATIGVVSNGDHNLQVIGKAGSNRWRGKRPRTRGVAMNPVDHPMGGGEGKSSGGHPRSRTGLPAKGFKTRSKKKTSNKYIIEKRK